MGRQNNSYDWAAYYAAAYEKERKQNTVLAGDLADAQRRQADYRDNLNRICSNPFWKMTAPARSMYQGITARLRADKDKGRSLEKSACLLRYEETLEKQNNRYQEWMNNNGYENSGSLQEESIEVHGWTETEIPDTDVIIITYESGRVELNGLEKVKSYFNENKDCMLLYADEDFYLPQLSRRKEPWFKPCYSPDTLLAFNYWGHMIAVRRELLAELGGWYAETRTRWQREAGSSGTTGRRSGAGMSGTAGPQSGGGLQDVDRAVDFYDLCLRLEEAVLKRCVLDYGRARNMICHLDGVLYHQKYMGNAIEEDMDSGRFLTGAGAEFLQMKQKALIRRGIRANFLCGQDPDLYHIVYDTSVSGRERCVRAKSAEEAVAPHRVVSVVIPSKDHPEVLENCLKTFRQRTQYRYYEWIVVDNGSNEENKAKMELLQKKYGFKYLYEPMPFNFSRMCNLGVKHARGDLILLLNDDIEIIEESWLGRMAGQALQPYVGAVGAKLWYAGTEQIQHAGITNLRIGPSHKLITFQDDRDYYYGHNRLVYDMAGVTGACLMVAREKYEQAGGLDEAMAVAYNDVDFCFRLMEAGYYNVQRNDAVLYHHESLSRGLDEQDEGKWERLLTEKERLYAKHPVMDGQDPFYHTDLVDNASDYSCNYKFAYEEHLLTMPVEAFGRSYLKKAETDKLQLIVDRAQQQHKICRDEPDIVWIMGWSYVPGEDNALYDRSLLLLREDGTGYCAVPADWHRKDVDAVLQREHNIGLSGFVLRVYRKDLEPGEYRIGMLCTNAVEGGRGQKLIAWSDKTVVIS